MEFIVSMSKAGSVLTVVPEAVYCGVSEFGISLYKIDIPDLTSLLEFITRVDNPIIIDRYDDPTLPSFEIEVYNGYRE